MSAPVICCFNASNLPKVASRLKEKYKGIRFKVCGDDDVYSPKNIGREKATRASIVLGCSAIFPSFKEVSSNPTDFNDLHCLEGLGAVKSQLTSCANTSDGYTPLGVSGATHVFLEHSNNSLLKASNLSHEILFRLIPKEMCSALFPGDPKKPGSIDYAEAKNHIIQRSKSAGVFSSNKIRGVGVWKDEEDTVINTGRKLVINGTIETGLNEYTSDYTYLSSPQAIAAPCKPLSVTECQKLLKALSLFTWDQKESPLFLAGWLALSRISGALPVRPHVWVTGPKGSGKSMLINDLILRCLGTRCTKVLGGTTAAGLRQSIASDARPIVFDEFESLENNQKQNSAIMDLLRQSWSFSTAAVIKGTTSGSAIQYLPNFSALLAGIRVHFGNDADRSRFTVLDLRQHDGNIEHKNRLVEALNELSAPFGERLWSRAVSMIETIKNNAKAFQDAISISSSQRLGAQLGHLLAGYYSLISDEAVDLESAKRFISSLNFEAEKQEVAEKDEFQCLQKLLTSQVRASIKDAEEITNETCTILSMINEYEKYDKALQSFGLRVFKEHLYVAMSHSELSKIFSRSRWHSWGTSLKRLPGARVTNVRIEGCSRAVVGIPWSSLDLSNNIDNELSDEFQRVRG